MRLTKENEILQPFLRFEQFRFEIRKKQSLILEQTMLFTADIAKGKCRNVLFFRNLTVTKCIYQYPKDLNNLLVYYAQIKRSNHSLLRY